MRVENNPINASVGSVQTPQVANPTTSSTEAAGNSTEATSFTPTSDLARLLSQVHQIPDARTEVIANVASRVATGDFNNTTAAAEAAENMLSLIVGD
jgi:hypothetical protein